MFAEIAVTGSLGVGVGVAIGRGVGRSYEQKAVAKVLSEFALVDEDTRGLVNRCYSRLSGGVKAELEKLLKR